jgi:transcriptional regulator with XRE-family HTH domain
MISTAQIRAPRGLLKWTQATLAHRAGLSTVSPGMIQNDAVRPGQTSLDAIEQPLEQGGVDFLAEDSVGVGVRFRRSRAV